MSADREATSNRLPNIAPKTTNQRTFFQLLKEKKLVVGAGCAGTGKTFLSCFYAARALHLNQIDKIILIRAYQPLAGRSIGFLPGELEDKLIPYYRQMLDYLEDTLGKPTVEIKMKMKAIEICSLETIRGRSWDNSIIIVDEAQNLFVEEIQALTTRIGEGSQMILIGDDSGIQTDIKNKTSGLSYLLGIVEKYKIEGVGAVKFLYEDILRSDITREFVIAYDKEFQEGKALEEKVKGDRQYRNTNNKGRRENDKNDN